MKTTNQLLLLLLFTSTSFSQIKYGIDIPLYYTNSMNSVSGSFSNFSSKGGSSYDFGIGLFIKPSEHFEVKAGFNIWNKIFNPTYNETTTYSGSNFNEKLDETGTIHYSGLYIQSIYQFSEFFFGGGIDISFSNSYIGNIKFYVDGKLMNQVSGNIGSIFTESFNEQYDIQLMFGRNITLSKFFRIKPGLQVTIPTERIFDTVSNYWDQTEKKQVDAKVNIVLLKVGIITEFNFN